jgi:hypothetical protein
MENPYYCSICDAPIGYQLQPERALQLLRGHIEYLLTELDCMAGDPPATSEAMTEYLRGLESYVKEFCHLLPEPEEAEEYDLELCA